MFGIGKGELSIIIIILLAIPAGVILFFRALLKSKSPGQTQSERLKDLQKMKDGGLINENEFNKKREEIIGDL